MSHEQHKCALVRLSGRFPFGRCANCQRSLAHCFVFRSTACLVVIVGLVACVVDLHSLFARGVMVAVVLLTLFLAIEINRETNELIATEHQSRELLNELDTLHKIIPICCECGKVRDDKGAWDKLDQYIRQHSDTEFSHSICPECSEKMYPGMKYVDVGQQNKEYNDGG